MEDKEALRILSECANGEKKLLFSDSLDLEQIVSKRLEKLEKLEKAFEILKGLLSLDKDTSLDGKVDFHTLYFTGELPYECYKRLTKEEAELLEEALGNENT